MHCPPLNKNTDNRISPYCDQILLSQLCINSAQNTPGNWIIQLLLSLLCQPKVILLSCGHCSSKKTISTHSGPGAARLMVLYDWYLAAQKPQLCYYNAGFGDPKVIPLTRSNSPATHMLTTGYVFWIQNVKIWFKIQSNSVTTNNSGPTKLVCYNRVRLYLLFWQF